VNTFSIEVTDTFSGEANYSWVRRFTFKAKSQLGAIQKLAREYGGGWKREYSCGSMARYNLSGCCVCAFVECVE
jgi:hypothetical protein